MAAAAKHLRGDKYKMSHLWLSNSIKSSIGWGTARQYIYRFLALHFQFYFLAYVYVLYFLPHPAPIFRNFCGRNERPEKPAVAAPLSTATRTRSMIPGGYFVRRTRAR